MATRAEQQRAEEQRKQRGAPKAEKPRVAEDGGRAAKKATYAREDQPADGQPSRKSTRGGKNRVKPDAPLLIAHEREQAAPGTRHRAAKAAKTRVRGKPA